MVDGLRGEQRAEGAPAGRACAFEVLLFYRLLLIIILGLRFTGGQKPVTGLGPQSNVYSKSGMAV